MQDIKEKYIEPPYTTDFALMFIPFEGLFAEILQIPGLFQEIQTEFKVTIAGPTSSYVYTASNAGSNGGAQEGGRPSRPGGH